MGQKVNPISLRIGIIKNWSSRWYAEGETYVKWLHEDIIIRKTLLEHLKKASVGAVEIERTDKVIIVYIKTARPGVVLGNKGVNINKLKVLLQKAIKNKRMNIKINVVQIANPNADAQLVANTIAEQIVNRASFRTVQKMAVKRALEAGAKGIKTSVAGRLGGVDMARTEGYLEGTVPLATLRQDIDYAQAEALTTYGQIGVKVWISHGEILPGELKREQRKQMTNYHRSRTEGFESPKPRRRFENNANRFKTVAKIGGDTNVNAKKD